MTIMLFGQNAALASDGDRQLAATRHELLEVRHRLKALSQIALFQSPMQVTHDSKQRLEEIKSLQAQGLYLEAALMAREVIQQGRSSLDFQAEIFLEMGRSQKAMGLEGAAQESFLKALEVSFTAQQKIVVREAIDQLAEHFAKHGRCDRRFKSITSSTSNSFWPEDLSVYLLNASARIALSCDDPSFAFERAQTAFDLSQQPLTKAEALKLMAHARIRLGDFRQALAIVQQASALGLDKDNDIYQRLRLIEGRLLAKAQDFPKAIEVLEELCAYPNHKLAALEDLVFASYQMADRSKTVAYAQRWREARQGTSSRLSHLNPFLKVMAGDRELAAQEVQGAIDEAMQIRAVLRQLSKDSKGLEQIGTVFATYSYIHSPELFREIKAIEAKFKEIEFNRDFSGAEQRLLVSLNASDDLYEVDPMWTYYGRIQMDQQERLLKAAEQLLGSQQALLGAKLKPGQKQGLQHLAQERQSWQEPLHQYRLRMEGYRPWVNLQMIESKLLNQVYEGPLHGDAEHNARVEQIYQGIQLAKIETIAQRSPAFVAKRRLKEIGQNIEAARSFLSGAADMAGVHPVVKNDLESGWNEWQAVMKIAYESAFKTLEESNRSSRLNIKVLDAQSKSLADQDRLYVQYRKSFESVVAQTMPSLISTIDRQIDYRLSLLRRWSGDLSGQNSSVLQTNTVAPKVYRQRPGVSALRSH